MRRLNYCILIFIAAFPLLSCERERNNPVDSKSNLFDDRPATPIGLTAEPGIELIRLRWQAVAAPDLAGYTVLRSAQSNGTYSFVPGDGDTTLQITTGKTSFSDSLESAGTFFYRIAAVDTLGNSSELSVFVGSTALEDKIAPEPPQNLSVVADETAVDRILLRWNTPNLDADRNPLTGLEGFIVFRSENGTGGFAPVDTLDAQAQSYTDAGLKALTVYAYTIMAFDRVGNQSALAAVQQTSTRGLAVPSALSATGRIGRIELSWQGSATTELLGYTVYRSTRSDIGYQPLPSREGAGFTTGQTTYVDSNLAADQLFFYKIQAVGTSDLVSELSGFVSGRSLADEVPPEPPQNLSVVADENVFDRVTLRWSAPTRDANGGTLSGLANFIVFRSEETTDAFAPIDTLNTTERTLVDQGLKTLTVYYYTLIALDDNGNESGRTAPVRVQTFGPDQVAPAAPQNLAAVADENTFDRVTLRWSAPTRDADNGPLSGLTGFIVFRAEENANALVPVDTLDANTRQFEDRGLKSLTGYFYTLIAFDGNGNESNRANPVQIQTFGPDEIAPAAPQNLAAVADENTFDRVTLRWSAPTRDADNGPLSGLTGFIVFRAEENANALVPVDTLDANTRQLDDRGLKSLTSYFYTVIAFDGNGNESNRATLIQIQTFGPDEVAPGTPQNLSAIAEENAFDRVTLRWSAPSRDADNGPLSGLAGYIILRSEGNTSAFVSVDTLAATARQFEDQGLESLVTYFYTIVAFDAANNESDRPTPVQIQTGGLATPISFTATGQINQIQLTWQKSNDDKVIGYNVYRSSRSDSGYVRLPSREGTAFTTGQTAYVDSNLAADALFFYQVEAVGAGSLASQRSGFVSANTLGDEIAPAPPLNLAAVADENIFSRVTLRWNAPTRDANGGQLSGLGSYVIFRSKETTDAFVAVDTLTANAQTLIDGGLEPLTVYHYTVIAVDNNGNQSSRAAAVRVQTFGPDEIAPATPLNLSAIADENVFDRVTLRWSAPTRDADGGELSGLDRFVVFRSKETTDAFAPVDTLTATLRSFTERNLEPLTTYFYTLIALDEAGNESSRSTLVQVQTFGPDEVAPATPQNLAAVADPNALNRITLIWSAPTRDADNGALSGLEGFVLFRSEGNANSFVPVDTLSAATRTYVDANLEGLTTYTYTLVAFDAAGNISTSSAPAQVQTDGLAVPAGLSAVGQIGQIQLSWQASTGDQIIGYNIYRSTRSDANYVRLASREGTAFTTGQTTYIDSNLAADALFFYQLEAVGDNGVSERSGFVSANALGDEVGPNAPQNLSAVADENVFDQVTLRWSAPSRDANGGPLSGLEGFVVFRSLDNANAFVAVDTLATDVRQFNDSGLKNLTTYFYTVIAFDANGNESNRANPIQVQTFGPDEIAPAAPQNLSVVADENSLDLATLRWTAPARDADGSDLSGLEGFIVFRSQDNANAFAPVDTLEANARQFDDSGLESLTTYFYSLTAFDAVGNESSRANPVQVQTGGLATPTGLVAAGQIGRIRLSWQATNNDQVTGYNIYRSTRSDQGYVRLTGREGTAFTTGQTAYVDSNLAADALFFYQVQAVGSGTLVSQRSGVVSASVLGDEVAPAAPQNLSVVADENSLDLATLRWTAPARDADGSNLSGLEGFIVLRSQDSANSFAPVDTLDANARQFEDRGLESLTTYFYSLTAFDAAGNESSRANPVQVQTGGLAAPTGLAAAGQIGRIRLSWQATNNDQVIGYNVYRSTRSDQGYVLRPSREGTTFTTGQTTYVDSNLAADALFFYQVEAVGPDGLLSPRTGFVGAAVELDQSPPAAPGDLAAIAAANQQAITLNWNAPSTDRSGGELTGLSGYIVFRSKGSSTALAAIDTVEASNTTLVDVDLEPSTVYFYTLSALDANGNLSPRSAIISALTSGIAPPAAVSANGGISRITVNWQASTVEDLQGYNVYRSNRSDQGYTRLAGIEGTPYTTGRTTFVDSILAGNAIFFYRVTTVTAQGESDPSAFSGSTVQVDTRAPSPPTFVDGTAPPDSPSRLNLNWKAPTTDLNGAELTGLSSYLVYRADNAIGPFELVGTSPTNTFSDTGLVAQTNYYYQVEASDQNGNLSPRSSTVVLTTNGVGIPQRVRGSASSPSDLSQPARVVLFWEASLGSILFYEVQRTTVQGSTNDSDFVNITPNNQSTARTDATVSRNTTYYYRVRARDTSQRVSDWSELVEVIVLP